MEIDKGKVSKNLVICLFNITESYCLLLVSNFCRKIETFIACVIDMTILSCVSNAVVLQFALQSVVILTWPPSYRPRPQSFMWTILLTVADLALLATLIFSLKLRLHCLIFPRFKILSRMRQPLWKALKILPHLIERTK